MISSPSIDAAHIDVPVEDGVVTLTGHLCTYAEKATVEDVVRRIKGVKGIAQEIEIRPSGTHMAADDEIAKRALDMINWNTRIPDGAIQVKVQNGWVTLKCARCEAISESGCRRRHQKPVRSVGDR